MDQLSELDPLFRSIDRFFERHLPPDEIRRRDEQHIPPYDLLPELSSLGLIRAALPESIGGLGMSWSTMCRLQEHVATRAFHIASIINRFVCFGAMPLQMFGTSAQKVALLPGLLDGRILIALALTEPEAGSDARAVRTSAEAIGGGWNIRGRKTWISDAGRADHLLTLCRNRQAGTDASGFTAFLVPRQAVGVSMTPLPKVGNNCMPSFDIGFDDVMLPDEARLGPVGGGFSVVTSSLKYSRASVSAGVVGTAQAALDLAKQHALDRVQFGRPIAEFQVIRHRLVDMHVEVAKARLMVRELARAIDQGEAADELSAMAKLVATDALQFVTQHGMQILASAGYAAESPMQRYWRDARLYTFGEGTNEIQREILAREIGLNVKPRPRATATSPTDRG